MERGSTIYSTDGREHQSTLIQSKIQSKYVYAYISQLHLLFYLSRSSDAMKFVRGFINNISRCIRKVLTIGEWLCTIFIAADREHKFTPLAIRFLSLLPSYKICHWLCQKQHKVCAKGIDHGRVALGFKGDPVEIISIPL